jgi:hypothetical protein
VFVFHIETATDRATPTSDLGDIADRRVASLSDSTVRATEANCQLPVARRAATTPVSNVNADPAVGSGFASR